MIQRFRRLGLSSLPVVAASCMLAVSPAAPASGMMSLEICDPDGKVRSVTIPLEQEDDQGPECAKPCHACLSRKADGKQQKRSV